MPEVNEVKGRVFAGAFIVTMVSQGLNHEVHMSMSVYVRVREERAGSKSRRRGRESEVTSYLCRVLTVTSGSADLGESYIDCEKERERGFMHITALIQGYACTENYGKGREREKAKERERGGEKGVRSVYVLILYSIQLIIPRRFDADRISCSRRSINV